MKHEESRIQRSCLAEWNLRYREFGVPDPRLLYAIPNGGKRGIITATIMKAEGTRRGVPDLCLAVPIAPYHALYIEMKTVEGVISPDQREMIALLRAQGYDVRVVRSVDEFLAAIRNYLCFKP